MAAECRAPGARLRLARPLAAGRGQRGTERATAQSSTAPCRGRVKASPRISRASSS